MVSGLERARLVKKMGEAGVTVQGTGTELLGGGKGWERFRGIPWTAAYQAPPSMGFSRQLL